MSSIKPIQRGRSIHAHEKLSLVVATGLILGIVLLGMASLPSVRAGANQTTYGNVQVYIQTSGKLSYDTYLVTAYNDSGFAVASTQSQYPAVSFELPNGDYIFTASAAANHFLTGTPEKCYPVIANAAVSSAPGNSASLPSKPVYCGLPASEYGYSHQQISTSAVVNISTQNLTAIPISTASIKVTYANGTEAAGVSVSANVLGGSYWGLPNGQAMWGTTDSSGSVTISSPAVPIQVSAWFSVPVNIPVSQTTVTRTIGGEKVNVTVYWQPTTVGLAGTAIVVPPNTSASITLHVQQPTYWATGYGGGAAVGYASGGAAGIPARGTQGVSSPPGAAQQQQQQRANFQLSAPQELSQPAGSALTATLTLAIAGSALAASAVSLSLIILRSRHQG